LFISSLKVHPKIKVVILPMPVNTNHALVLDGSGDYFFIAGKDNWRKSGEKFIKVDLPEKFLCVVAGYPNHSLGIAESDGSLWAWGSNYHGQLGLGKALTTVNQPTKIQNSHSFIQISAGNYITMAVDSNGEVWYFGDFSHECVRNIVYTPKRVESLREIKSVSCGSCFWVALGYSGKLWSFGANDEGNLGLGDFTDRLIPCKMKRLKNIVQIASGFSHSLILDTDGCVWSFGRNNYGQLGLADTQHRNSPELIPNLKDVAQVYCGGDSSMVKNYEHQVFVFGSNQHSKLRMDSAGDSLLSPVEQEHWKGKTIIPGGDHTLIVDEQGNLFFHGTLDTAWPTTGKQEGVHVNYLVDHHKQSTIKRAIQ
jgi:alpha-tubulin suppressor-like RCC1 family protein